ARRLRHSRSNRSLESRLRSIGRDRCRRNRRSEQRTSDIARVDCAPARPTSARNASRPHLLLMTFWLGIDVGTGGTRALLVNAQGKVVHSFIAPHEEIRMERPMWAEQRPENWWDAGKQAIRGVLAQAHASGNDVRGIGISGQMHG